jgi:hypothetical protein
VDKSKVEKIINRCKVWFIVFGEKLGNLFASG